MADQNQKPTPQQPAATPQPAAEKREYIVKHKIIQGGRDARKVIDPRTTPTLRLTDGEAAKLGEAVELKRSGEAPR